MKQFTKITKTIFLLLFVTTGLSAAEVTWVNAFPFYVYGDVSFIASVYEFVSAVVVDSTVQIILGLGFTIAALMAGYRAKDGNAFDIFKSVIAPITLYIFFVAPSVNVHITDLRVDKGLITYNVPDGGYKKVEDVPFAIAAIPASSSMLVSLFIDLVDNNWGSISVGSQFSSLGYQGISRLNKEAMMISQLEDIDDANISATAYNLNQYIKHCLIRKGFELDNKNRHTLTHPSKPFPDMWDPANYAGGLASATVSFDSNKDADGQPVDGVTCATLYAAYVSGVNSDIEAGMKDLLAQRFPGIDPDSTDLNDAWSDQTGVDLNIVGNIGKAMTTTAMTRALEQSFQVEGIGVSGVAYATEISMQTTMANLRTEGLAKWDWLARVLPDGVTIILGILIGAFPLMIIVMSFMGKSAMGGIANFFMGYIAINFNLVSLALVNNIISYYTAQHAQDAIVSYAGMPFGLTQVSDFMMQQADMAGFAGLIGLASIGAVTPLIFKGETAGFGAAIGALSGAYRGNVMASASKELTDYDAQQALDRKVTTADGMTEAEAGAWLSKEGFTRPANMSAVESYNAMMKNYGAIGAADPASIMHSGNAGKFNTDNYISGSAGQSMQSMGKTAGLGANMNSGGVNSASMADIGSVSIEDGEIMGSTLHNTRENRDTASNSEAGFDTGTIGAGMAAQQVAKEMASQEIGKDAGAFEKLTASARQGALEQLATGAASADKMFGNNGFGALSGTGNAHLKNVMTQAAEKISSSAGRGSTVDYDAANSKAFEDGARDGSAVNRASKHMLSGEKDKDGRLLYDRELAAEGQALGEMAKHAQSMGLATAVSKSLTGEKDGYADYMTGMNAQSRKSTNDAIGIGEKFGAMSDSEQIDLMKKNKENAARGFEGGIKAANAELHANGRSVDKAIADDITGAIEKGVGSSTHADNLRDRFGNDLKGKHDKGLSLSETMGTIDGAKLDSMVGQAMGTLANTKVGVDYADNAMYGEMSNQQSTKAKLDVQDGVEGATGVAVTGAREKAIREKAHADNLVTKFGADLGNAQADDLEKANASISSMKQAKEHYASLGTVGGDAAAAALDKKIAEAELGKQNSTLSSIAIANDLKSMASEKGSAAGFNATEGAFGKTAQMAEYKERSGMESMSAQIASSGGMDKAVQIAGLQGAMQGESSRVSMHQQIKGVGGGGDTSYKGLDSKDAGKIAESLSQIAQAQGKAEAAKNLGNMDAVNVLDKLEGGAGGRGGFIGVSRDEAEFNAIGTGKDMEYMMRQTGGDRAKAITKADHISDMKTVSSNAAMSLAEDVFGGNAEVFEAVKNAAIIGGAVMALAPGAGKVGGMVLGGFDAATGKVKGKDSKGGRSAFSSENAKDVEEYLDNNKGARSATGIASKRATGMSGTAYLAEKEANQSGLSPVTSPRTTVPTTIPSATTTATNNPNPITSPSSNNLAQSIAKSEENTKNAQATLARAVSSVSALDSSSDADLGRSAVANMVSNKLGSLPSSELGGAKHASLLQLKNDVAGGGGIDTVQFSKAMDMKMKEFAGNGVVSKVGENGRGALDMDSIGSLIRPSMQQNLDSSVSNATISLQNAKLDLGNAQVNMSNSAARAQTVTAPSMVGAAWAPASGGSTAMSSGGVAPAYAQNAFSTPTGFNTMQAMYSGFGSNPKSAYNDTTNVANSIAGEYKANTAQESLDKTADVALGTEFIQDSVEGMNETIQKLMDSGLYGGKE